MPKQPLKKAAPKTKTTPASARAVAPKTAPPDNAKRSAVDAAKEAKAAAKTKSRKGLRDASDPNLHKRLASDRISADVADFEKAGGTVEKLGVTKVLLKIPVT
jgi:uncharacterized protein (DUF4415 family)